MALVISIVLAALVGIIYGVLKKNKKAVVLSVIALVVLAILMLIYLYLYSQNPY